MRRGAVDGELCRHAGEEANDDADDSITSGMCWGWALAQSSGQALVLTPPFPRRNRCW